MDKPVSQHMWEWYQENYPRLEQQLAAEVQKRKEAEKERDELQDTIKEYSKTVSERGTCIDILTRERDELRAENEQLVKLLNGETVEMECKNPSLSATVKLGPTEPVQMRVPDMSDAYEERIASLELIAASYRLKLASLLCGISVKDETSAEYKDCHLAYLDKDDYAEAKAALEVKG